MMEGDARPCPRPTSSRDPSCGLPSPALLDHLYVATVTSLFFSTLFFLFSLLVCLFKKPTSTLASLIFFSPSYLYPVPFSLLFSTPLATSVFFPLRVCEVSARLRASLTLATRFSFFSVSSVSPSHAPSVSLCLSPSRIILKHDRAWFSRDDKLHRQITQQKGREQASRQQ